jgi:hypothetical protein
MQLVEALSLTDERKKKLSNATCTATMRLLCPRRRRRCPWLSWTRARCRRSTSSSACPRSPTGCCKEPSTTSSANRCTTFQKILYAPRDARFSAFDEGMKIDFAPYLHTYLFTIIPSLRERGKCVSHPPQCSHKKNIQKLYTQRGHSFFVPWRPPFSRRRRRRKLKKKIYSARASPRPRCSAAGCI